MSQVLHPHVHVSSRATEFPSIDTRVNSKFVHIKLGSVGLKTKIQQMDLVELLQKNSFQLSIFLSRLSFES